MAEIKIPRQNTTELDYYATMLFQLPINVQFCHHLTTSFAAHKALDEAYEAMNGFKDSILEQLIGCMGFRYSTLNIMPCSNYSEKMNMQVAEDISKFALKLMKWADEYEYSDVSNLAQEMLGTGNKLKYLLTLK